MKKKESWRNFVTRNEWQNIELLSNQDESIMKYYKIDGIPRFMIFDKVGNRAGERVNVELTVCKNGQAFLQNEKL